MFLKILFYAFLFIASLLSLWFFDIKYSFNDFKEYITTLIGASGMVFTIMGIWIAILYPNAMSRIVRRDDSADLTLPLKDTKRLESIVASVLKSALALTGTMTILLFKVIFYKTPLYANNVLLFKNVALSLIITLSYIQLESIAHVVISNVMFINNLHDEREKASGDIDI